jgi:FkbM family methyltransferase
MKYSIIIPTMWRCPQITIPFLAELSAHPLVDEIIIIDNDHQNRPKLIPTNKVKITSFGKNVYVNPAWNFGVKRAKNDLLCIVNDDIAFDLNLLKKLKPLLTTDNGTFGLCPGEKDFNQPLITNGDIDIIPWSGQHTYGYGCLFFLHKQNWQPVPQGLEVYYGDNYIFDLQLAKRRTNYLITNMKFKGLFAQTTSDKSISNGFLDRESLIYQRISIEMTNEEILKNEYIAACDTVSDINRHVPILHKLAQECESVVELGVRTGVSTRAFLPLNVKLRSYDIEEDARVTELFLVANNQGKDMQYIMGDSLKVNIEPADMMFVDTVHSYDQVSAELARHGHKIRKYIAFHDTFVFGLGQENVLSAVIDYVMKNPEWEFCHYDTENNGLTVIKRKSHVQKKKVLIALPTNRNVETDTLKSIYDQILPEGIETELQFFYGYQIDQIRNLIAEWGKRYDYLFCVDSDIVLPNDALARLIAADKDVVSGLYIQRKPGHHILEIYEDAPNGGTQNAKWENLKGRGLVEIAGCGFGCVLVKGDVLRTMPYPHFVYKSALDHAHTFSEDVYFCLEARKHGFKIWADTSLLCEHIHSMRMVVDTNPPAPFTQIKSISTPQPVTETQVLARYKEIQQGIDLPPEHKGYLHMLATQHKINPRVIFDIGSSVLHWTRFAKQIWPTARIIPFEAMQHAGKFYEREGLTEYVNELLTDQDGKLVKFYQDLLNPGGNSYYQETTGMFTEDHAVFKTGITLDTLVDKRGFPMPDMIKMDTQGSELDILKGSPVVLRNVYDIIIEAQHVEYNKGAPGINEVRAFLEANGFRQIAHFATGNVDGDYHFKRIR